MAQSPLNELFSLVGRRDRSIAGRRVVWQEFWVILLIALIVVGLIAGKGLLLAFGVTGMIIVAVSWLWNAVALQEVHYERILPRNRAFIGEEVPLVVSITNNKPVPLGWLKIEDRLPQAIQVVDPRSNVRQEGVYNLLQHSTAVSWYEKISWEYRIKCDRRGYFRIGPAVLDSGDIFGFYSGRTLSTDLDHLLVYPTVVPLRELGIPAFRALGDSRSKVPLHEDPSLPSTIREYQRGDPVNRIAWKSSARAGHMQVRTFDSSASRTVMLAVGVETTSRRWEGYLPALLERAITTAASIATYATEQQYSLGLFSNGAPHEATHPMRIEPSRSREQLTQIMEALATINPVVIRPMARYLSEHARGFPVGSTVVVATAFLPQEMVDTLASMKSRGHPILVVYVGDDPAPEMPPGIPLHDVRDYFERMERDREFRPD